MEEKQNFLFLLKKSFFDFLSVMPMIVAIFLLLGIFQAFVSTSSLHTLFQGYPFVDTFIGTFIGGIAIGSPIVSYVLGGELLNYQISLFAITALILSWVTLGALQLPLELELFGKRFTFWRNFLAFLMTLMISLLAGWTLSIW